jgi:hypothetical protein
VAGRRAGAGLALAAIALSAAACGSGGSTTTIVVHRTRTVTTTVTVTTTRTVTQASGSGGSCSGSQLSGVFSVVPGSGGAGQIAYALRLTNTSQTACTINGLPVAQLLDASGSPLPTKVTGPHIAAVLINLEPGSSAKATARFSPSVPGTGDSQSGPCQPKAYTLRVTPNGGGMVDAPIRPPTSVCEKGTLNFGVYGS